MLRVRWNVRDEERRDVDNIAARGGEIRNADLAGAILDQHEIVAVAEQQIAGEGAALAKDETVCAVAENDIADDAPVVDHGFLARTAQNCDAGAADKRIGQLTAHTGQQCDRQVCPLQERVGEGQRRDRSTGDRRSRCSRSCPGGA